MNTPPRHNNSQELARVRQLVVDFFRRKGVNMYDAEDLAHEVLVRVVLAINEENEEGGIRNLDAFALWFADKFFSRHLRLKYRKRKREYDPNARSQNDPVLQENTVVWTDVRTSSYPGFLEQLDSEEVARILTKEEHELLSKWVAKKPKPTWRHFASSLGRDDWEQVREICLHGMAKLSESSLRKEAEWKKVGQPSVPKLVRQPLPNNLVSNREGTMRI